MHIHEGALVVDRVQALVDWSHMGQYHHSILRLGGGLSSCGTQDVYQIVTYIPGGRTKTLLYRRTTISFFFFFIWNVSRICVSSLRRGHANLLCIVPILVYVLPKRAPNYHFLTAFPSFLHSLTSLKILNYWDLFKGKHRGQASIPTWLRPKMTFSYLKFWPWTRDKYG